ncbi:MAG: hypothetical protein U9N10_00610 [Bacillota bacterium]|nr:hypothetical protein [Bacillota bacterium]
MHNLSDRTPFEHSVTVPSSYKVVSNLREEMKIYYIKDDLHELDAISYINNFGNEIKIYNLERTICDILRSRNRMDIEIINKMIKNAMSLKVKIRNYARERNMSPQVALQNLCLNLF